MIKFIRILDKLTIASLLRDHKAVLARVILVPGTKEKGHREKGKKMNKGVSLDENF